MRQERRLGQELSYAAERFFELRVDRRKGQVLGAHARDQHDVDAWGQPLGRPPKRLASKALDAVSHHRVSCLARDHEAQARGRLSFFWGRSREEDKNEMTHRDPPSSLERAVELGLATNASLAPERSSFGHFL